MTFDWRLGIFLLQFVSTIVTVAIFCMIKFNDLKHLTIDVNRISKNIDKIFRRIGKVEKAIVRRDAICEERHSKKWVWFE